MKSGMIHVSEIIETQFYIIYMHTRHVLNVEYKWAILQSENYAASVSVLKGCNSFERGKNEKNNRQTIHRLNTVSMLSIHVRFPSVFASSSTSLHYLFVSFYSSRIFLPINYNTQFDRFVFVGFICFFPICIYSIPPINIVICIVVIVCLLAKNVCNINYY